MQHHLLWLLLASYVLGALLPRAGSWIRSVHAHSLHVLGGTVDVSAQVLMLAFLLVVAALGTRLSEVRLIVQRPQLVLGGLVANWALPVLYTVSLALLIYVWPEGQEVQNLLVGLALVSTMPIAGSSTAWSQNAEGNLAVSLGLVLGSTLLSPVLTPVGLHAVGLVTRGDYSEDLQKLAREGSTPFLLVAVVVPSVVGLVLHLVLGTRRVAAAMPWLKLANLLVLLLLNYANASAALPQTIVNPDWDFLALVLAAASALCLGAFALGWWLTRLLRGGRAAQVAMMYGLGMNNNGTGMVLASMALSHRPLVLLPIISYNMVQQIVAGIVDAGLRRLSPYPPL